MPVIEVKRDRLFKRLEKTYTDDEFEVFLFEYGLELDDITSLRESVFKETGVVDETLNDDVVYKIDVPANRYDLLCEEGIARALLIFMEKQQMPQYKIVPSGVKVIVESEVNGIRPYVACAILRGVTFDDDVMENFIKLQTKLHGSICRRRSLASVGTHDLDTIEGPFVYTARKPESIVFAPLDVEEVMNGHRLVEYYEKVTHISPYLELITDKELYPVIYDKNNTVCSLPPIINGNHSKITANTKNIFIEVTGTDDTKTSMVLNTMVTMFSEYCKNPFEIESVEVVYKNGTRVYPTFEDRQVKAEVRYLQKCIGVDIPADDITKYLARMSIPAKLSKDKTEVIADIHPTRTDVFHKCDLVEDVGIAYGFNNLEYKMPSTLTQGGGFDLNETCDMFRNEVARAGYTELLNFSLVSFKDSFDNMRKKDDGKSVIIANPATQEFQMVRRSLLPGILKTISHNRDAKLPLHVFEVSDTALLDPSVDTGAKNERELCAVLCSTKSKFGDLHGLLDKLMMSQGFNWKNKEKGYIIRRSEDESYLPGHQVDVVAIVNGEETVIGRLGVLHPEVILNFKLQHPCTALTLKLDFFNNLNKGE